MKATDAASDVLNRDHGEPPARDDSLLVVSTTSSIVALPQKKTVVQADEWSKLAASAN